MSQSFPFSSERQSFQDIPPPSEHANQPRERMGILSLTVTPSPAVRWILPARIRSSCFNDVVFVGSTYVQLREFCSDGRLSNVTAKLNFDTQILGATVISAKAETVSMLDAILGQERDEVRFWVKDEPIAAEHPPQIVVLATATCELIYVYAKVLRGTNSIELVFAKRALLADILPPEKHLRHIAIDPESKIMATASYAVCTIFILKDVDDLKDCIDAWDPRQPQSFQPSLEQRVIQVDGHILKMEFLRPVEEEPDKVILILLVANEGRTTIVTYTWRVNESLNQMRYKTGVAQALPYQDRFPLLLIPSKKRASFAIVTETAVVFYDNLLSMSRRGTEIPLQVERQDGHKQLWVQWAKPSRHNGYLDRNEDILLIREDGFLSFFTRPHALRMPTTTTQFPGVVKIDVDSAVCMLPGPQNMGGDILIVGGSMRDGGVFHLRAQEDIAMLQVIPNISPVHDVAVLDSTVTRPKDVKSQRTFVTVGVPGASSLTELRLGHEARIDLDVLLPSIETITSLWTLEDAASKKLYVLASHPEHTTALAFDLEMQPLPEVMPVESYPGLALDVPTLAADMLSSAISLQITTNRISAGFELESPEILVTADCVCADISPDGAFTVACKKGTDHDIRIGAVQSVNDRPSLSLSAAVYHSPDRPLCLSLFHIGGRRCLSVGYPDGRIDILSVGFEEQLAIETSIRPGDSNDSAVTSIVVLDFTDASYALLLAGTRDGKLKVIYVAADERMSNGAKSPRIACKLDRIYQIGMTPVTVLNERISQEDGCRSALLHCGSRLDRILLFQNNGELDYMLVHVWLSMYNDLKYAHPHLNAVHRVGYLTSLGGAPPSGFIMCATQENIFFACLIEEEQIVPRCLSLKEQGARLVMFSKLLNKFIIASNPSPGRHADNLLHKSSRDTPTLYVVDSDETDHGGPDEGMMALGESDEEVKVLLSWEPTNGKRHFDLIMIGLEGHTDSRLGFVTARKLISSASAKPTFKQIIKFVNKELHALCALGQSSLVVGVGHELVLMRLDVASKRWYEDARYVLPSAALSLSAQGSVIYVATQLHSKIILSWREETRVFEKVLADHTARDTRAVLPFGKNGDHFLVTTASNQGTSLLAYAIGRNPHHTQASPLFEADMPLSFDHIDHIPTSWTPGVPSSTPFPPAQRHQQQQQQHFAFQGIAFDGTVVVFHTLSFAEWELLHFLEQLAQPNPAKSARKARPLLTQRMARDLSRNLTIGEKKTNHLYNIGKKDPRRMHVRGDVIKRLIDGGPMQLKRLLGVAIDTNGAEMATEHDTKREVIQGEDSDVVMVDDTKGDTNRKEVVPVAGSAENYSRRQSAISKLGNSHGPNGSAGDNGQAAMAKLESLASPVLGCAANGSASSGSDVDEMFDMKNADISAAVLAWARKLLRATIF